MADKTQFLSQIWDEIVNSSMTGDWIDATLEESAEHPDAPFADVAGACKRLLDAGGEREDLCRIVRWASFETAFILLDMLRDPEIDKGDYEFLSENLLDADPSGLEGRPGSWPSGQSAG